MRKNTYPSHIDGNLRFDEETYINDANSFAESDREFGTYKHLDP